MNGATQILSFASSGVGVDVESAFWNSSNPSQSFSWEVPAGVFSVSMAGIETAQTSSRQLNRVSSIQHFFDEGWGEMESVINAPKGPDLVWKNNISVTPGETLTVFPALARVRRGATNLLDPSSMSFYDARRSGGSAFTQTRTQNMFMLATSFQSSFAAGPENLSGYGFVFFRAPTSGTWSGSGSSAATTFKQAGDSAVYSLLNPGVQLPGGGTTNWGSVRSINNVQNSTSSVPRRIPSSAHTQGGTTIYIPNNLTQNITGTNGAVSIIWPGTVHTFPL